MEQNSNWNYRDSGRSNKEWLDEVGGATRSGEMRGGATRSGEMRNLNIQVDGSTDKTNRKDRHMGKDRKTDRST